MTMLGHDPAPPARLPHELPPDCEVGRNVRVHASRLTVGRGVRLGDDVVLVGDEVRLGDGVAIGPGSDLRASSLTLGEGTEIGPRVRALVAERLHTGRAGRIATGVELLCRDFVAGNLLYLGDGTSVGYGGTTTSTATVRIGNRVTVGQHTILNANCPIDLDDNVGTGSYLAVWTHGYHFGHGPLAGVAPAYAPVHVGRNVWLGFQVTLLPGVTIGENTMVAAGSVVTGPVPGDVLVAGAPAKVKKQLDGTAVTGAAADRAVTEVLRVWVRELMWKGCTVSRAEFREDAARVHVALADGADEIRAVLLPSGAPAPRDEAALVLVSVEDRPDIPTGDARATTVFELRSGRLRGRDSALVQDLRDQLRRHAMPCGDSTCFSAVTPAAFSRLAAAVPGR
ncbi:DapH/DapD/GlmU-related protein [Streptomyces eurythermus]|uniref:DapH/DapD/GlmU-related protein n=1 Tax=Streptomyces eurythermus TaxID=42237 RepID=UPI0036779CF2